MEKLRNALWADYVDAKHQSKTLEVGSDAYEDAIAEREKTVDGLIQLARIEADLEKERIRNDSEDRREKNRNKIAIGTFVVTAGITIVGLWKSFKFDETSTMTSTMGPKILNGIMPKIWKR